MLQVPFASHPEHYIADIFKTPLQALIFIYFLQDRHFKVTLSFIGESEIWITLFGATSYIASTGRPSETVKVENKY